MPSLVLRFRPFIWFLIISFTLTSTPHIELVFPYMARLTVSVAYAANENDMVERDAAPASPDAAMISDGAISDNSAQTASADGGSTPASSQGESASPGSGGALTTVDMSLFTGSVATSIPIEIPPGRKGMAPHLALKYNNYQKTGWVGVGWTLDMGSIQRSTKWGLTYNDQYAGYVAAIDGASEELVPRSDWGTNYYGSRVEGAVSKYYFNTSTGGWEVTALNGTKYYYGSTRASRQDFAYCPPGLSCIPESGPIYTFKWCLDKVVDPNGNYMTVSYHKPDGNIYLDQIQYAGNGSTAPTNRVEFHRMSAASGDGIQYFTGFAVQTTQLLQYIDIYASDSFVRRYALGYDSSEYAHHWLLTSVTQYGNDGITHLPVTTFEYNPSVAQDVRFTGAGTPNNFPVWSITPGAGATQTKLSTDPTRTIQGDFNGDGLTDLAVWIDGSGSMARSIYVLISTGKGFLPMVKWGNNQLRLYLDSVGHPRIWVADFNGDGKMDLASSSAGQMYVSLANETGTGFLPSALWGQLVYDGGGTRNTRVGDFNGDGFADMVSYSDETHVRMYLSNGVNMFVGKDGNMAGSASSQYIDGTNNLYDCSLHIGYFQLLVWLGDYNGDGKTDIATWNGTGNIKVYFSQLDTYGNFGFSAPFLWDAQLHSTSHWGPLIWTGDFNGDGKTDLLSWTSSTEMKLHITTGDRFIISTPNIDQYYSGGTFGPLINVGDFNGDGKTDVMSWSTQTKVSAKMNISVGDNFVQEYWNADFHLHGSYGLLVWPGDYDGDGRTDIAAWDETSAHPGDRLLMHLQSAALGDPHDRYADYLSVTFPDLLKTVHNGLGGSTTLTYTPSSWWHNSASPGGDGWTLPFILQTVSKKDVSDGRGTTMTGYYAYWNGSYSAAERGFFGFGSAYTYQMNGSAIESTTEADFWRDAILKGQISYQKTTSHEGHTKEVTNTWQPVPLYLASGGTDCYSRNRQTGQPLGVCFPAMVTTTATITDIAPDGSHQYSRQTDYQYNDPNVLKVTMEHKYGATVADIVSHFSYNSFGKPTDITVADFYGNIQSRKWMDYDIKGTLLTEEMCKSDTPAGGCINRNPDQGNSRNPANPNPVVTYTYYPENGNPWTITGAGNVLYPDGCATTMTYDGATSTFVYNSTNCLNHTATTTYDPGTGKLLTMIPPYLQGTSYGFSYTYDALGRILTENNPDGGVTVYGYHTYGDPNSQAVQKSEEILTGLSVVYHDTFSFFDGLGRTYRVETTGPNDDPNAPRKIYVDTFYDNVGRVFQKSNPYFSSPSYWTQYWYDGFSRVFRTLLANQTEITTAFKGLCREVTNQRGFTTKSCFDVFERVNQVTDALGTVTTYNHDILGNLTQVLRPRPDDASLFITTSMTYDSMSKKKSMNDPDMGPWTYDYDKSGNLKWQMDNNYQQTNFTYDRLNRVSTKTTSADTVTYTYDTCGPPECSQSITSPGKLIQVKAVNNSGTAEYKTDTALVFDVMQRITKSRKSIGPLLNPVSTVISKEYDSAGRMMKLIYFPDDPIRKKQFAYTYDTTFDSQSGETLTAGNIASVTDVTVGNNTLVVYSGHNEFNKHTKAVFPKAYPYYVETNYTYDPAMGRLATLKTQRFQSGTPIETFQDLIYQFDANGNAHIITDNANGITHDYEYDDLDRLTSATGVGAGGYAQGFTYDTLGNILTKSNVGTYYYDYGNKPHAVHYTSGLMNINLTYDGNGNMTQRAVSGGNTLNIAWTPDNKPLTIIINNNNNNNNNNTTTTTTTYTYDGNRQRVKKQGTSGTTLYFGELYEERPGRPVFHIFAGSTRVMSIRSDGNQTYHGNHLNSASIITDDNGAKREKIEYDPFGTYRVHETSSFPLVNYTFTDQEYDDESGLYNYKARLYDPVLGRFISPDSIVPEPGNLQAFNRYSYCVNNPVTYTDPSGHMIFEMWVAIIIIGMLAGGITAARMGQNPALGAVIGGATAAAGAYVAGEVYAGMGGTATGAASLTAGQAYAAGIVAGMAGGFTGGAIAGAANSAVYGGNMLQGALYGGLYGAGVAAAMAGVVGLAVWARNAQTSQVVGEGAGKTTWEQGEVDAPNISPEMQARMAEARQLHLRGKEQCGKVDLVDDQEVPRLGDPIDERGCFVPRDRRGSQYDWHTHRDTAWPSDIDEKGFNPWTNKGPGVIYGKDGITVMDPNVKRWNWIVTFDYY